MRKTMKRFTAVAVLTTLLMGGLIGSAEARNGNHGPRDGHKLVKTK